MNFRRKYSNSTFSQTMLQSTTISKICKNLPLFEYSNLEKSSFPWYYHKKISKFFKVYFFKEFEFLELEFHDKFEFHKLKFQKDGWFLHIYKTVIDYYFFC